MSFLDDLFFSAAHAYIPGTTTVHLIASVTLSPSSNNLGQKAAPPTPVKYGYAQLPYTASKNERLGRFGFVHVPAYFDGVFFTRIEAFAGWADPVPHQPGFRADVNESTGWMGLMLAEPQIAFGAVSNYEVTVSGLDEGPGTVFIPAIDSATNVIYGAAGADFVAIALSGPFPEDVIK